MPKTSPSPRPTLDPRRLAWALPCAGLVLVGAVACLTQLELTLAHTEADLDGRVAASDGTSRWITGSAARQHVHEQRAASEAIIVGTGTVFADDPSLTARGDAGELMQHQPVPVVLGDRVVPDDAAVRRHPNPPVFLSGHDLAGALVELRERGVRSAYVEAGPVLAGAFVREGLVDEFHVYLAPTLLGGPRTALDDIGVHSIAAQRNLCLQRVERLGNDLLVVTTDPAARTLNPWQADPAQLAQSGSAVQHTNQTRSARQGA